MEKEPIREKKANRVLSYMYIFYEYILYVNIFSIYHHAVSRAQSGWIQIWLSVCIWFIWILSYLMEVKRNSFLNPYPSVYPCFLYMIRMSDWFQRPRVFSYEKSVDVFVTAITSECNTAVFLNHRSPFFLFRV